MEFRVEEIAPCRKRVTVSVPAERVRQEFDSQYGEVNKSIALPGFRPGHIPRKLLESRFGKKIAEEVKHKIVESAYEKLIEEKKLAPLTRPSVDVEKAEVSAGQPFEFGFEVVTRPEFDLPEWKGREVLAPPVGVTEAQIDAGVERMRVAEGTLVPADGGASSDDVVVISYEAKDGETSLATEENAYYRIGRGVIDGLVAEGLDKAILGAVAGTKAKVKARAPADDPRPGLSDREFDLWLEVREVKRFKPADLDADFLKRHDFDDAAEMRQDVRRKILRMHERERDRVAEDRLIDALVTAAKIPLPAEVVENAVTGWLERRRTEAQAEGVDEETITKELTGSKEEVQKRVEADLRGHFVLEKICEAEDVKVSEQEILGAVEQIARDSGRPSGEIVDEFQESPERLAELRSHLRHQKARDMLRRAARLVEETPLAPAPALSEKKSEPAAKPKKGK